MRTTIQQAACNALAGYLEQKFTDVVVEPRWPDPDKLKPSQSITVITAGSRRDLPMPIHPISKTIIVPKGVTTTWQIAACTQPLQLDVWALSDVARDDIMAQLDDYLNAGESALAGVYNPDPTGHGVLLSVADGWESTTADFYFDSPDTDDLSTTTGQSLFRATYRGEVNFMLTVTTTTARQQVIDFQTFLT